MQLRFDLMMTIIPIVAHNGRRVAHKTRKLPGVVPVHELR